MGGHAGANGAVGAVRRLGAGVRERTCCDEGAPIGPDAAPHRRSPLASLALSLPHLSLRGRARPGRAARARRGRRRSRAWPRCSSANGSDARDALWLDSGDALEGAEVFHRFGGRVELELLSALGLGGDGARQSRAVARRRRSWGSCSQGSRRFPVLSANLRPRADSALAGRLAPSALLERRGRAGRGRRRRQSRRSPPQFGESATTRGGSSGAGRWRAAVQAAVDELAPRAGADRRAQPPGARRRSRAGQPHERHRSACWAGTSTS